MTHDFESSKDIVTRAQLSFVKNTGWRVNQIFRYLKSDSVNDKILCLPTQNALWVTYAGDLKIRAGEFINPAKFQIISCGRGE